jgi:hypothetical protein
MAIAPECAADLGLAAPLGHRHLLMNVTSSIQTQADEAAVATAAATIITVFPHLAGKS